MCQWARGHVDKLFNVLLPSVVSGSSDRLYESYIRRDSDSCFISSIPMLLDFTKVVNVDNEDLHKFIRTIRIVERLLNMNNTYSCKRCEIILFHTKVSISI